MRRNRLGFVTTACMAIVLLLFFFLVAANAQNLGAPLIQQRQFNNTAGAPLALGKLCTYAAGTSTPLATFSERTLATPNAEVMRLTAGGYLQQQIYLDSVAYKFVLKTVGTYPGDDTCTTGTTVGTWDYQYDLAALYRVSFATKMDDKVCHASQYTGSPNDLSGKVAACVAVLPSTGGSINALGLEGAQIWSVDAFTNVTKPIVLLLGASTITSSVPMSLNSAAVVAGLGAGSTIITAGNGKTAFNLVGNNINVSGVEVRLTDSGSTSRFMEGVSASSNVYVNQVLVDGNGAATATFGLVISSTAGLINFFMRDSIFTDIGFVTIENNNSTSTNKTFVFDNITVTNTASGINMNHPDAVGSTTDITVTNSYFNGMVGSGGWGVGLSGPGVQRATISNCTFIGSIQELLHIEDRASQIEIVGNRFLKSGTTTADRGLIQIVNGAQYIAIHANSFDLTGASGAAVNVYGINITLGGAFPPPHDIAIVGNAFLTKSLNYGIGASGGLFNVISGTNTFRNPVTADKAEYLFAMTGGAAIDSNHDTFYDAGAAYLIDVGAFGIVSGPNFTFGDATTADAFEFAKRTSAATDGSTSFPINGFRITRPFDATAPGTANNLFPIGVLFDLRLGMRFIQNGINQTFVSTSKQLWNGTLLTTSNQQTYSGASSVGGCTFSTSATDIVCTATGGGLGTITISADGQYIPTPAP